MKFNLTGELYDRVNHGVEIGDVYSAKGGNGPCYWIVVAITERSKTVKVLGVDSEGEICSATSYYRHYFEGRERVGFAPMFRDMVIDIENI